VGPDPADLRPERVLAFAGHDKSLVVRPPHFACLGIFPLDACRMRRVREMKTVSAGRAGVRLEEDYRELSEQGNGCPHYPKRERQLEHSLLDNRP
jgi:hypothetical protein